MQKLIQLLFILIHIKKFFIKYIKLNMHMFFKLIDIE